jgi:hypothetical protein
LGGPGVEPPAEKESGGENGRAIADQMDASVGTAAKGGSGGATAASSGSGGNQATEAGKGGQGWAGSAATGTCPAIDGSACARDSGACADSGEDCGVAQSQELKR